MADVLVADAGKRSFHVGEGEGVAEVGADARPDEFRVRAAAGGDGLGTRLEFAVGGYPYLWLDAKVEKVRDGGRVVRKCLVIAHGVHESGRREVIGIDCGEAETEAFWRDFLRSLVKRGLAGVQLVVSDAHEGLKNAIGQVLGAPWQRCIVHCADFLVMPTSALEAFVVAVGAVVGSA